jgi:hypothetical protein
MLLCSRAHYSPLAQGSLMFDMWEVVVVLWHMIQCAEVDKMEDGKCDGNKSL